MLAWILVYVPSDKPYLCAQRNNYFEMIRNLKLKLKNVTIKQLLIKVITSNLNIV